MAVPQDAVIRVLLAVGEGLLTKDEGLSVFDALDDGNEVTTEEQAWGDRLYERLKAANERR